MEKWKGEKLNLIKASEIGFKTFIENRLKDLEYVQELESHFISVFDDYSEEEVKKYCSEAVYLIWKIGEKLKSIPTKDQIINSIK